jgi:AraC-like DNA-binding protein
MGAPDAIERFTVDTLLVRNAAIEVMSPRLGHVAVHWHDFYELCYVIEGRCEHIVNGEEQTLRPGSTFLLSPTDFHEILPSSHEGISCYNVVIDPPVVERQLDELVPSGDEWVPWVADDLDHVEADFRRLRRESERRATGADLVMEAMVRCILVELARAHHAKRAEATGADVGGHGVSPVSDDLRRAVRFVERHFREPVTLADAAAQAHLSPNYFSERFRASTGTTFQSYLQNRRLQFARSLLASTPLAVTEVCHVAGFNSLSHFGRAYRRRYGVAPAASRLTSSDVAPS